MKTVIPDIRKGLWALILFLLVWAAWQTPVPAQDSLTFQDPDKRHFFEDLFQKVARQAAAQAYDYQKRPLIRTAIAPFHDASGKETALGKELRDYLGLRFSQEKQFALYGREEAVGLSLHSLMLKDPAFKTSAQRAFQESQAFSRTPVDLVISGTTQRADDGRIRVEVHLIPLFERVGVLEGELNVVNYSSLQFLGPPQSPEAIQKALALLEKPKRKHGRLIVLSRLDLPDSKGRMKEGRAPGDSPGAGGGSGPGELWKAGPLPEMACWLDEKEIKILRKEDWDDSRKRLYRNILSGFQAGQIWADQDLPPGEHTLMVSLFPVNGHYKTFRRSFQIEEAVTYYLVFSLDSDQRKEPVLQVRMVADAGNSEMPF
jgi:hypothetical protein